MKKSRLPFKYSKEIYKLMVSLHCMGRLQLIADNSNQVNLVGLTPTMVQIFLIKEM